MGPIVKLVAQQRTTRHRDTSDPRSRKVEAEMAAQAVGNRPGTEQPMGVVSVCDRGVR